jgi:anti-sigma regulatory factor (Ser/Thr protein kinase)
MFVLESNCRSVQEGRARVVANLTKWGLTDEVIGDAELIASELLTNAVRHAHRDAEVPPVDPHCSVILSLSHIGLIVGVWDEGSALPVLRDEPSEEGGRGLRLVEALSVRWGTHPMRVGGKLVFARLAVPKPERLAVGA